MTKDQHMSEKVESGLEVVGYGMPNTSLGGKPRMMMLQPDIPADDQYGGALWEPLVRQSDAERALSEAKANIDRLTHNPADHRYWEGRYRDEAATNEKLQAEIQRQREQRRKTWRQLEQVTGLLRDVQRYMDDETTTPAMMARLAVRIDAALAAKGGE